MSDNLTAHTFTYKEVKDTTFEVDVYLPEKAAEKTGENTQGVPVLVNWHGGSMVCGSRENNAWFPQWLIKDALKAGFAVISPDYTLCSPHSVHDSLRDAVDCFKFLETGLNIELAKAGLQTIDASRIAVSGSSAGGYMSYLCGLHCTPQPKAIVGLYPQGGDYFTYNYLEHKTEPFLKDFGVVPILPEEPWRSFFNAPADTPIRKSTPLEAPWIAYYAWLAQQPIYLDAITGIKGLTELLKKLPTKEEQKAAIPPEARKLFPQLVVDKSFPPTLILHGDEDTIVGIYESRSFKNQLDGLGVECVLEEIKGAKHGFDMGTAEAKDSKDLEGILPWIVSHV